MFALPDQVSFAGKLPIPHPPQSGIYERSQRMYEQLEDWYDQHPEASFGEIEAEARKRRRELMGKTLEQ